MWAKANINTMLNHSLNTFHRLPVPWLALVLLLAANTNADDLAPAQELFKAVPKAAEEHGPLAVEKLRSLASQLEKGVVQKTTYDQETSNEDLLEAVTYMLKTEEVIEDILNLLNDQRSEFINLDNVAHQRDIVRSYLACMTELVRLSGRLRYYSFDFFSDVGYDLEGNPQDYAALIDLYIDYNNSVGSITSLQLLLETLDSQSTFQLSDHIKGKILLLARLTREIQALPFLVEILRNKNIDPELLILVIDTIRHLGLPQNPLPDGPSALTPPVITGEELLDVLSKINTEELSVADQQRWQGLQDWISRRNRFGVQGEEFRFGQAVVREGDWLLMKNPSPYNRFTDLYPGLFTHAGVVTTAVGKDGRRRFVVVDLPEVENAIPATPVEKFVERTLDFVILRHGDPGTLKKMGNVAKAVIGNKSKFDLNFRTTAIKKLRGQNLEKRLIEGYCAGLLLLCAQETQKPLKEFFPIEEHPAAGNTLKNLARLDVSMPSRFLSPTGPFFSPQLKMIYRCHTMYSPRRQIEQTIYDHFARGMRNKQLEPSLSWYQSLRLNVAQAAETNAALSRVIANAAGVNQNIDLVAAAKLGAVIQSLDLIARGASANYKKIRNAFRLDVFDDLEDGPQGDQQVNQIVQSRREHADLFVRWEAGVLSPRELRVALVNYYIDQGCNQLDEAFFSPPDDAEDNPTAVQISP